MRLLKKFSSLVFALFTAFQAITPVYAQDTTSMFSLNVVGEGHVTVIENNQTHEVDNGESFSTEFPEGTAITIRASTDGVIEDITQNGQTISQFQEGKNSLSLNYVTDSQSASFVFTFGELTEENNLTMSDEQESEPSSTSKEQTKALDTSNQESQDEELNKASESVGLLINSDTYTGLKASEEDETIRNDYEKGETGKYLEKRKALVEKINAQKYVDDEYFLVPEKYYEDYSSLNVLLGVGGSILIRPGFEYSESSTNQNDGISTMSIENPKVTSFWEGALITIWKDSSHQVGLTVNGGIWRVDGHVAYCGEAALAPPSNGASLNASRDVTSNENLRKVIYYGIDGPDDRITAMCGGDRNLAVYITNELTSYCYSGTTMCSIAYGSHWSIQNYMSRVFNLPSPPSNFKIYAAKDPSYGTAWTGTWGTKQTLIYGILTPQGSLRISKSSSITSITNGNDNYSVNGAQYGLYSDSSCRNLLGTFTVQSNGLSNTISNLDVGTYYLKETKAPTGYSLDTSVIAATVSANTTTTKPVTDKPQSNTIDVLVRKTSTVSNSSLPTLANAEFTVKYYDGYYTNSTNFNNLTPTKTWVIKTDSSGNARLSNEYKVSGDSFYTNSSGQVVLPLGTVTIQETKPPVGFHIDSTLFVRQITSSGNAENVSTYNSFVLSDVPNTITGKKQQAGTSVNVSGAVYLHTKPDGTTETATSNAYGEFQFMGLTTGTHYFEEIDAPDGYDVNPTRIEVEVNEDGTITMVTPLTGTGMSYVKDSNGNITLAVEEEVSSYSLKITKINEDSKLLDGAEFTLYEDEDCTQIIETLTSKNGIIDFGELENDTHYYLKETKAPMGYRIPFDGNNEVHVYDIYVDATPQNNEFNFYVDGILHTEEDTDPDASIHLEGTKADRVIAMTIVNYTTLKLPTTGSKWTAALTCIGTVTMTIALIYMHEKKKVKNN